ncbi:MAG: hypothetical protein GQ582_11770 [Methyloprofundus sp.]|nr:hypothetical protein [Methyloprofundus sp.]
MNIINRAKQKEKILINRPPHVSSIVFVKTKGSWAPEDAVKYFGFHNFQRVELLDRIIDRVWFYDDSEWFHILEGWYYPLYNQGNFPLYDQSDFVNTLLKLSSEYDVFWFSVGDADCSFNYSYYSGGECKRKFVVKSPRYDDRVIEINEGKKLPYEDNILNDNDEIIFSDNECVTVLLKLAESLGIKTKYDESNFQGYK